MKALILSMLLGATLGHTQELTTFIGGELYSATGEMKGGTGLRFRQFPVRHIGYEISGQSLTPRDSIVDRADVSLATRLYFFKDRLWLTGVAGYGANFEDHQHGPGVGAYGAFVVRNDWFIEGGVRGVLDDSEGKFLLTLGVGKKF